MKSLKLDLARPEGAGAGEVAVNRLAREPVKGRQRCKQQASGKEPLCRCRRLERGGFCPWVGKIPWRRARQPRPVLLPGDSRGQRSLAGCSPCGCRVGHDRKDLACTQGAHTRGSVFHWQDSSAKALRPNQALRGDLRDAESERCGPRPARAARPW